MRTGIGPHPEQTRPRKINYFGPLCQEIWILAICLALLPAGEALRPL